MLSELSFYLLVDIGLNAFSDHPLALYCFSQDTSFKNKGLFFQLYTEPVLTSSLVFDNTQSGSAVANDVLVHCASMSYHV